MKDLYLVNGKVKELIGYQRYTENYYVFADHSIEHKDQCFDLQSNLYNIGDSFKFCVDPESGETDIFYCLGVNLVTKDDRPTWQYFLVNSARVHIWFYENAIAEWDLTNA
jgi:hypothetical protein